VRHSHFATEDRVEPEFSTLVASAMMACGAGERNRASPAGNEPWFRTFAQGRSGAGPEAISIGSLPGSRGIGRGGIRSHSYAAT